MESLMDRSVIRIHLKTAKKNDRMDVCSRYLKMARNSAIIISKLFETIYYFPESFSNHEVQSYMQRKSHRTFPSLHKCIYSLNQQNQNVVLVNTKCAYAMEETDCLVKILLDLSNKYKNVIDLEYDAVKNCLQDKHILDNGQEDVSVKHTDNFESRIDSGNTKCQNQDKKNTMQKRQKVLKPRSKNKDFPRLLTLELLTTPIFRIRERNPFNLMDIVNSGMDPYSLCERNESLGEIVDDDEGPSVMMSGSEHVNVLNYDDGIRCPQYQAYHVRLSTFTKWPSDMTQKPEHVAGAGFYYTGLQDAVRCFSCDGGLQNWDPQDDPWIEHCRLFPQCLFVRRNELEEEEDSVVHSTFQRNNPMAHPPDLQQLNLSNDTDEPSQLDTDAAQSVIQTGYSKSAVAIAVEELIRKGKREFTSQDIMEVILEKEDKGELLPKDGRSELPQTPSQSFRSIQSTTEDMRRNLRENESLTSVVACMKCKVQSRSILFLPCTHHCLCEDCAENCFLCPVCYKIVNEKIKTFMI